MKRPHVLLVSHEVAPLVRAGGIGRHVAYAAELIGARAEVTVVVPSGLAEDAQRTRDAGWSPPDGVTLRVADRDPDARQHFASPFHADAAEVARLVAVVHAERPVDLVEVDDYLGLGAVLVDGAAAGWRGLDEPVLAVRLHTTWEMAQALDGTELSSPAARWVCALERRALRAADVLIAPNDEVAGVYQRFYGPRALAPAVSGSPAPFDPDTTHVGRRRSSGDGPLALLYAGRLEERKGVRTLVEAVLRSNHDIVLSLAGGDTDTARTGGSMRGQLEQMALGDKRVRFLGRLSPEELDDAYEAADLVVIPSRFESFGYVLREALAHGRPVLATPTAGFTGLMTDPRAGWLTPGFDAAAIDAGLGQVLGERQRLRDLLASGAPRDVLLDATAPEEWTASFLALVAPKAVDDVDVRTPDPVTAVVLASGGDLRRTLATLETQGEPPEVVVVANRASRVPLDALDRIDHLLVCPEPESLSQALALRTGAGPILLLRAGETLDTTCLAQLRAALDGSRRPAYATAWTAGGRVSARPLGGPEALMVADYGSGGTVALLSPEAIEREGISGADAVAVLVRQGADGVVVPEVLVGPARQAHRQSAEVAVSLAEGVRAAQHELWDPIRSGPAAPRLPGEIREAGDA